MPPRPRGEAGMNKTPMKMNIITIKHKSINNNNNIIIINNNITNNISEKTLSLIMNMY